MRASGLVRAGLDDWKRRSPASFWRVRNGAALARWFWVRLQRSVGRGESDYDDEFWIDQDGDWDGVAELIRAIVNPRAVVDIGCGQGLLMEALGRRLPAVQVAGLEDSQAAIGRARNRGLNVVRVDIAGSSRTEIDRTARSLGAPDLAICLEVAEHLPSWHSAKLLRLVTIAPIVLFSAARPNQGGVLHVNERSAEYWQSRFAALGYELSARDPDFRARLKTIDLPWWYTDNTHLFERAPGGSWPAAGS
jgi:hypothetical protein